MGDNVSRVLGIVNGTTNFILTKMDETGADFADALAEAQALGYAEADPTADIEGHDAAAKAAILAALAFHSRVTLRRRLLRGHHVGDRRGRAEARAMDHVIKLLAICERSDDGKGVAVRVHPAMVPGPTRSPGSATPTTRSSSRATPPGSSCSTAAAPAVDHPVPRNAEWLVDRGNVRW